MVAEITKNKEVLRGGEFLIKDESADGMFIPEDLNEEQEMIRQMVKDFAASAHDRAGKIKYQVELLQEAGELGLLSSHIPEEYGGMLMDNNANTVIYEELGAIPGGFSTTVAAHTGIGTLPILYFGTEAQKAKYLPDLGSGQLKAAYCLTEPGSGSDALAAKTRADEDGDEYILNGQKMWISNGGFADIFIVFAQLNGDKFTGFIVERERAGVSLGAEEDKLGIKGSSTRQVFFENVRIPKENLLGTISKGHLIAFNILNVGRYKLGVMSLGGAKAAADIAIKYANERHQFKQPISNFGAIQYKLAEMAIRLFALETSSYRISDLMQQRIDALKAEGKTYEDALLDAAEEYAVECSIIKVYGSETAFYVADENVQVHGGYGFSEEYMAAQIYRDVRIGRIYEGTNEINRMLMVNMIFKSAMKGKLDLVGPAWAVQKELASMPSFEQATGTYGNEIKAVKDFKKIVLMVAGAAAKMQMEGQLNLRAEQEILSNLADMMIDLYNAESLLLRTMKLADRDDKAAGQKVYDSILRTYITDANFRIQKNATDALTGFAEGDLLKTLLMGLKRFTKYTPANVKACRRTIAAHLIAANGYDL